MATEPQPGAVPFEEAIAFLRGKLRLTSRGWTDVWQEQNAVAFTVAGAQSAALVADFHQAITEAIEGGGTLAEFRARFDEIVARHGWSYRGKRAWRTRVIFETNLRTAYQAGRWQQAWEMREERPWLRYVAILDDRTRPVHRQWNGTLLPITAAWWKTHYPPNGWGCRCTAQSLSDRDIARRGLTPTSPAPLGGGVPRRVDTPDGFRIEEVPPGIDPGWAYNVGEASLAARRAQEAARDIGRMPADLGAEVGEAMAAATRRALAQDYRGWLDGLVAAGMRPDGTWRALGALSPTTIARLEDFGATPATAGVAITADQVRHLTRDAKAAIGRAIDMADIYRLPEIVDAPDAVLREKSSGLLLLVFAAAQAPRAKLVVQIDFARRLRTRRGDRAPEIFNAVKSGGIVPVEQLRDRAAYDLIEGAV
jgi:SPP1 gp7 family putative phage head morphogenesis protein